MKARDKVAEITAMAVDLEDRAVAAEGAFGRLSNAAVAALTERGVPPEAAADELNRRIDAAACGCGRCLACQSARRGVAGRRPVMVTAPHSLTRSQAQALELLRGAPAGTVVATGLKTTIGARSVHTRTLEGLARAGAAISKIRKGGVIYEPRIHGAPRCPTCGAPPLHPCRWEDPTIAAEDMHDARTRVMAAEIRGAK